MMRALIVCVLLAAVTFAVYWPALSFGFVDLDDPDNVAANKMVLDGLSVDGVIWAFTTDHADYWHPITWLSLMLDSSLLGVEPRGYHLTNVVLHAVNAILVLGVLTQLTGAFWRSAAVAALFALHPLRVESVAWITERKDMLSMLFFLLTISAYARYARAKDGAGWPWYVLAFVAFALGLMSKPMLVTVPMVLLLLDLWPLGRLQMSLGGAIEWRRLPRLVFEKVPLLLLTIGSCIVTLLQGSKARMGLPLEARFFNIVMSYARYLGKTFWPGEMVVHYPYPGAFGAPPWALWQVCGAAVLLTAISVTALILIRRQSYVLVGWLMFLGMLVPVIGLLQVSSQSIADRFTYIPMIGVLIIVIWTAAELAQWKIALRVPLAVLLAIAIGMFAWQTSRQLPTWRDTDTLYQHALARTQNNWRVHGYYADYLFNRSRFEESKEQLRKAIALMPNDPNGRIKLAYLLARDGDYFEAQGHLEHAVRVDPTNADAYQDLGNVQSRRGDHEKGQANLEKAMRLNPAKAAEYGRTLAEIRARRR
jgi:protein O-mannosyl-transferase